MIDDHSLEWATRKKMVQCYELVHRFDLAPRWGMMLEARASWVAANQHLWHDFFGPENRIQRKTQDNNGKLCLVCVLPDSRILHTGASSKARPCTSSVISIPWRFASGFPQQTPFELLQIEMVQGWVTLFERCSKHWLGRNQERRKTKLHLQDGI